MTSPRAFLCSAPSVLRPVRRCKHVPAAVPMTTAAAGSAWAAVALDAQWQLVDQLLHLLRSEPSASWAHYGPLPVTLCLWRMNASGQATCNCSEPHPHKPHDDSQRKKMQERVAAALASQEAWAKCSKACAAVQPDTHKGEHTPPGQGKQSNYGRGSCQIQDQVARQDFSN